MYPAVNTPLKEAESAVRKLAQIKPLLSPQDEETLEILMDQELMNTLSNSIREAEAGEYEPIETILE